jgi:hypothetical protein
MHSSLMMRRVTARIVTASRTTTKPFTRTARRVIASSSMSSPSSLPNDDKESELRELWATSYDGWIDAPGAGEPTIYFRPAKNDADVKSARTFGEVPPIARTQYLFAVTAHNPMGVEMLAERNRRANDALLEDLKRIPNATATWESFGFSAEWREDGYVCAFEDGEEGRETMVAIAKKYAQGAIYAYEAHDEFPWALRRRTVSAAMSDAVDADVIVVRCEEPPFVRRE